MEHDRVLPPRGNPLRDKREKRTPWIAGPCAVVIFGVTGDLARKKLMPAIYDLGQPRPAAAQLRAGRVRPARPGGRGLLEGRLRRRQAARAHTVPAGGVGPARRGIPVRAGRFRRRRGPSAGSPRPCTPWTPNAAPAAITPSTCRFHRRRSRRCSSSCPSRVWPRSRATPGAGSSSRSRSGMTCPAPRNSTLWSTASSRSPRCSASTTIWARRRCRTSWRCASPIEMFEPIWNAHYVDHVQITMAEDIGLGGRGGYYDGVGAARDVIQNHLIQLLALTAMEEPVNFSPAELQAEKIKVLGASRRWPNRWTRRHLRGQYAAGWQGGEKVVGLLDEEGFSKTSSPRRSRPSPSMSTPAGGRASRSICAPENAWAAGSPRSHWSSSGHRICRSTPP